MNRKSAVLFTCCLTTQLANTFSTKLRGLNTTQETIGEGIPLKWGVKSCSIVADDEPTSFFLQIGKDLAAVRCCHPEAGTAIRCTVPNTSSCAENVAFAKAEEQCKMSGMELCTKAELVSQSCCSSCNDDPKRVIWSRTSANDTHFTMGQLKLNQEVGRHTPVFDKRGVLCKLKAACMHRALNYHLATDFTSPLPSLGKCALVSSSGVLNYHSHGAAIDGADTVIRFNDAPVRGYENAVGSKTSLRIVNEKLLDEWVQVTNKGHEVRNMDPCIGENCAAVKYLATCTICNVGTFRKLTPDSFHNRENNVLAMNKTLPLYSSNLGLEKTLDVLFKSLFNTEESPAGVTTGSVGMVLALSMCDEVKAYGLAESPQSNKDYTPYHYYAPKVEGRAETTNWHRTFDAEKLLWRSVADDILEVDRSDIATVPGFRSFECQDTDPASV